jgi:hypothetical protein
VDAAASPYAPSWYDRLQDRVESRTGLGWAFWVVAGLLVASASNGLAWLVGHVPVGVFDPYVNSGAAYFAITYGGMHYLDTAAGRAWRTFRPATELPDDEAARFAYELTTMPARPALMATLIGVGMTIAYTVSQYGRPFTIESQPVLLLLSIVVSTVGFVGTAGMYYHALHQLRVIGRVHRYVGSIDPLHLSPLHAFAGVTAATGILLLALGYLFLPTNPLPLANPVNVATGIVSNVLAVACFVVPLIGIRDAIAGAKATRLAEVNGLLASRLGDLHDRAARGDLTSADQLDSQLTSLRAERELVAAAPTWPWDPQTLRGFSAAIVIPIVLWLVYRLLERTL